MNPSYDFQGHVALVTGASSAMGLAAAQAFAQAGAAVVLADVNEPALQGATDGLTGAGHQAMSVICDVSDEDQVAAAIEQAISRFGRASRSVSSSDTGTAALTPGALLPDSGPGGGAGAGGRTRTRQQHQ